MTRCCRSPAPLPLCYPGDDQNRDDGFRGLQRTYGFEVPAGRLKVLQAVAKAFPPSSAALTNEVMAELNRQRSAEGRSPRRVARDWLGQHGFIASGS